MENRTGAPSNDFVGSRDP